MKLFGISITTAKRMTAIKDRLETATVNCEVYKEVVKNQDGRIKKMCHEVTSLGKVGGKLITENTELKKEKERRVLELEQQIKRGERENRDLQRRVKVEFDKKHEFMKHNDRKTVEIRGLHLRIKELQTKKPLFPRLKWR